MQLDIDQNLDEEERDRAEEFCSLLIANGYLPVAKYRDVLYNEALREIIDHRLNAVGMRLIYNVYSEHIAVGLNEKTAIDEHLEWSNNFGLGRGAMALLLILWCKFILPKRLDQEAKEEDEKEWSLLQETFSQLAPNAPTPNATIRKDQIVSEFGETLGGVTNISKYISQLTRAKIIRYYGGVIEEGPLMSLVINEDDLNDELRKRVLISVLQREQSVKQAAKNNDLNIEES